jgi:uncharacterized protein YjlB
MKKVSPPRIQQLTMSDDGTYPNNEDLPVLIYRNVLDLHEKENRAAAQVKKLFRHNDWRNSWKDGIYDYHHYHSITHEVLGVYEGSATVKIGGLKGKNLRLKRGDVIIIPAGVAHMCVKGNNFKCVGAYPGGNDYDMNYGYATERPHADENITRVRLPLFDPVFGEQGPLFKFWKSH